MPTTAGTLSPMCIGFLLALLTHSPAFLRQGLDIACCLGDPYSIFVMPYGGGIDFKLRESTRKASKYDSNKAKEKKNNLSSCKIWFMRNSNNQTWVFEVSTVFFSTNLFCGNSFNAFLGAELIPLLEFIPVDKHFHLWTLIV